VLNGTKVQMTVVKKELRSIGVFSKDAQLKLLEPVPSGLGAQSGDYTFRIWIRRRNWVEDLLNYAVLDNQGNPLR